MLEDPSQPYDPATNRNIWERYFGYQAPRDYIDRVAGWTEQHELGHFDIGCSRRRQLSARELVDHTTTISWSAGYQMTTAWGYGSDIPPLPEHPEPPTISLRQRHTRTITVTPNGFRALNNGFPHDDANLLDVEMR